MFTKYNLLFRNADKLLGSTETVYNNKIQACYSGSKKLITINSKHKSLRRRLIHYNKDLLHNHPKHITFYRKSPTLHDITKNTDNLKISENPSAKEDKQQKPTHNTSSGPISSNPTNNSASPASQDDNSKDSHSATTPSPDVARSQTYIVETIHGRSRRWMYEKKTGKLIPQWMWSDDEEEFDKMINRRKNGFKMINRIIHTVRNMSSRLRATFHSTLLPAGFPDSVHSCYRQFSIWQFVETTAASVVHVLCSQAMLSSVGLPTSAAAAAGGAVAIRWIAKDGLAHFAKLIFTKMFAHGFDFRPKTWSIIGEVLLMLGSIFELGTAVAATNGFPGLFIPLAAFGASLQSVGHLAWEATHATFIRWLSLRNNIADVTAKADSQMVVSELLGLMLGVCFIQYYHDPAHLLLCFTVCAPIHILCTLGRVKSLRFGMLTMPRILQLFNAYTRHHAGALPLKPGTTAKDLLSSSGLGLPSLTKTQLNDALSAPVDSSNPLSFIFSALNPTPVVSINQSDVKEKYNLYSSNPIAPNVANVSLSTTTSSDQAHVNNRFGKGKSVAGNIDGCLPDGTRATIYTSPYSFSTSKILSFASPEQCHKTDQKFGEWFHPDAWHKQFGYCQLHMGDIVSNAYESEVELFESVRLFEDELYLLNYKQSTNALYICYEEDAAEDDILMSLLHATKVAHELRRLALAVPPISRQPDHSAPLFDEHGFIVGFPENANTVHYRTIIADAKAWTTRHLDPTQALMEEAGWDTEIIIWSDHGNRVYWELPSQYRSEQAQAQAQLHAQAQAQARAQIQAQVQAQQQQVPSDKSPDKNL